MERRVVLGGTPKFMTPRDDAGRDSTAPNRQTIRHGTEVGRTPTESVIEAVSEATGTPPHEMPVLYDVIDPDALDALFESGETHQDIRVTFQYEGYDVRICADGRTVVSDVTDERS